MTAGMMTPIITCCHHTAQGNQITMSSSLVVCTVSLHCAAGITWTESVHQTPALLVQAGQSAQMSCSHQLHGAYYHMYWFQQFPGESMELIVHTLPFQPPEFSEIRRQHKYSANKTVYGSGTFTVKSVEPSDVVELKKWNEEPTVQVGNQADSLQLSVLKASTVFTQRHGKVSFFFPAYFGGGTKLTVLGCKWKRNEDDTSHQDNLMLALNVTIHLVKVLEPSAEECQSRGDKKNRKTLVCVASGFYPDVVSVSWRVDGREVAGGVATDTAARRQGRYYDLASSLRVPLTQWFTAGKNFSCTVSFYNGNETVDRSDWVRGIEGPGAEAIREEYLRTAHTVKLSYAVLIAKNGVYGAFVAFLVWRLQRSCVCAANDLSVMWFQTEVCDVYHKPQSTRPLFAKKVFQHVTWSD
ncbi:hypothetical protein F2P81_014554 [Scophthalmus maximus]|uniref:Ig-like domain-containing protein n=1 Tax=Scophthalmus maximus TaxID=52904 RepID=A0A6A4SMF8_SCOMX|nr:hypothetical protein F2P81_014554 [Scophthalmus maximus]